MARDVTEQSAAAAPAATAEGVVFIKNRINEIVVLPGNQKFKFAKSRITVSDPKLIEGLKKVASKYGIFIG